jgi:hypothetical protein
MQNLNLSQHLYLEEFGKDVGNKDAANVNPIDDDLKKGGEDQVNIGNEDAANVNPIDDDPKNVEWIQQTLITRMQLTLVQSMIYPTLMCQKKVSPKNSLNMDDDFWI